MPRICVTHLKEEYAMTRHHWTRSEVVVGLSLLALGIAIACSQIDSPRSPESSRVSGARATLNGYKIARSEIASTMPHLEGALREDAWIGEMHNTMLAEVIKENAPSSHPTATSVCRSEFRSLMAHRDEIRKKANSAMSDRDYGLWILRSISGDKHCRHVSVMSLFGTNRSLDAILSASQPIDGDSLVTNSGIALANTVATAIGKSSGYPNAVAAAAEAALATAGSMSAVDYSMGEAVASVGVASSNQFLTFATSGTFDSTRYTTEQSLFRPYGLLQWWTVFINPVVKVDALGCAVFVSVAGAYHYTRESMRVICLAGALTASGGYIFLEM
jgi:hypothetical protein